MRTCVALALLLLATSARAQAPASALIDGEVAWQGLTACASESEVAGMLTSALGGPLRAAPGTHLEVSFTEAYAVSVTVTLSEVTRTRRLETTANCRALDEALVVVIALLVDEVQAAASPPAIAVPVTPSPDLAPPEAVPAASAPSLSGALAGGAALRIDALPGLAAGAVLLGELRFDAITVGAGAAYFPSAHAGSAGTEPAGAEVSAVGGTLGMCALVDPVSWLLLGGCLGAAAFLVSATGVGLEDARTSVGLELDVLGSARLDLELWGPLWVRAELGVGLAAVRSRVYLEQPGGPATLHITSIAFPTAFLGLQARLGD